MLAVRPAHRVCTSPSTLPAAGCRKCSAAEPLLADNSCGAEQQDKGGLAKFFPSGLRWNNTPLLIILFLHSSQWNCLLY